LCRNVFGEGVYPDVFMTNLYYGGTAIAGMAFQSSELLASVLELLTLCHFAFLYLENLSHLWKGLWCGGRAVQWDATHQSSNPGAALFSGIFF